MAKVDDQTDFDARGADRLEQLLERRRPLDGPLST
jgi:hypothetical protein